MLERRKIRDLLIAEGYEVRSHTDGSISVAGEAEQVLAFLSTQGYEPREIPGKINGMICVAMPETVAQGNLGKQFYRGPGGFALTGERAEVYLAGGLQALRAEAEAAQTAAEAVAEEPVVEEQPAPRPRRARRSRRTAAAE